MDGCWPITVALLLAVNLIDDDLCVNAGRSRLRRERGAFLTDGQSIFVSQFRNYQAPWTARVVAGAVPQAGVLIMVIIIDYSFIYCLITILTDFPN